MKRYDSPRWSGEILDCSMPMTMDTYSLCSYRCLYCFSFFQKALRRNSPSSVGKRDYLQGKVRMVDPERVKRIFSDPDSSQFGEYVKQRIAFQWGGLADQFDENERKYGVTLSLLPFFREIEYPISFSTKATWWTQDARYIDIFRGADHFNVKVSIITLDEEKARQSEILVPTPKERLAAIGRLAKLGIGGVTLRLRPFIFGISTPTFKDLIHAAAQEGAEAVSTEFLCMETRSALARNRFELLGGVAGYDLIKMHKLSSKHQSGYLRGNREMKRQYIDAMQEQCEKDGLRFYVSDAHFKERCANGSCCGLRPDWNYSRGQFTEALQIAKREGRVTWGDIAPALSWANVLFSNAGCGNMSSTEKRSRFYKFTQFDYMHYYWNAVNEKVSPYKYFGGVLHPVGRDEAGDVIYEYRGDI